MLFPCYYYSIKINFFKQTIGKISRFRPATCRILNRQLIGLSIGNLSVSAIISPGLFNADGIATMISLAFSAFPACFFA